MTVQSRFNVTLPAQDDVTPSGVSPPGMIFELRLTNGDIYRRVEISIDGVAALEEPGFKPVLEVMHQALIRQALSIYRPEGKSK